MGGREVKARSILESRRVTGTTPEASEAVTRTCRVEVLPLSLNHFTLHSP